MWKGRGLQVQKVSMVGKPVGGCRREVKVMIGHGQLDKVGQFN